MNFLLILNLYLYFTFLPIFIPIIWINFFFLHHNFYYYLTSFVLIIIYEDKYVTLMI